MTTTDNKVSPKRRAKAEKFVSLEIIRGVAGDAICLCNEVGSGYRLAGPKPWGGGTVIKKWKVPLSELIREAKNHAFK